MKTNHMHISAAEIARLRTDNARLRALNAELLEALMEIVEYRDCGDDEANMDAAIDMARTTIAKAKGG
jgi:hypothetical protein